MRNKNNLPIDSKGKLEAYAWPGGYPILYLLKGDILCPKCANKEYKKDKEIDLYASINWQGPAVNCDECNARIESAYGEVENET